MKALWCAAIFAMLLTTSARGDGSSARTKVPAAAPIDERLQGCEGLPRLTRSESLGDGALVAVARAGAPYLVFPQQDRGCEVFAFDRGAARVKAKLARGTSAFAMRAKRCSHESCPVAVAVRGVKGVSMIALRTNVDCDAGLSLRAIKLFSSHESLELVCRSTAGAGWQERRVLLEVMEDTLGTLYTANTGSYVAVTAAEKKAGARPSCPVGSLRVEKAGEQPLLRVVDPTADLGAGALRDGKGSLPARQLGYDAKRHELVPTGAPDVMVSVDAHAACRRR